MSRPLEAALLAASHCSPVQNIPRFSVASYLTLFSNSGFRKLILSVMVVVIVVIVTVVLIVIVGCRRCDHGQSSIVWSYPGGLHNVLDAESWCLGITPGNV